MHEFRKKIKFLLKNLRRFVPPCFIDENELPKVHYNKSRKNQFSKDWIQIQNLVGNFFANLRHPVCLNVYIYTRLYINSASLENPIFRSRFTDVRSSFVFSSFSWFLREDSRSELLNHPNFISVLASQEHYRSPVGHERILRVRLSFLSSFSQAPSLSLSRSFYSRFEL